MIFLGSPLVRFTKFNNFLCVCWFLRKIFLILYPWTCNSIAGNLIMCAFKPSSQPLLHNFLSSIKDHDPTNYIRLSNFPKDKRLENPSLSLIVGRILLLCIASIKKRRQCAQNWTFDNTGNTIVFVIESKS